MTTPLLPPARQGFGEPNADAGAFLQAFGQLLTQLDSYRSSSPNDLLISGIVNQAQTLFVQAETVGSDIAGLTAQVQQLQTQLSACQSQLASAKTSAPSAPAQTTGVAPATAAFIAIGAALTGGVVAYGLRGMIQRKR